MLINASWKTFPNNFKFEILNFKLLWTQGGLAINSFFKKIDILFVPSHTVPLIRKPGLKTVVTVHDLGSEYFSLMHQLKQRIYLSLMQKCQLQTATKIIAVSNATKQDLIRKIGLPQSKIEVVYEGYREGLKPLKSDLLISSLKGFNIEKDSYFLFVGTVQPRKNIERLIRAFNRYTPENVTSNGQDLRIKNKELRAKNHNSLFINPKSSPILVIAGSKGWLSDEIFALPKNLGIEDRVKFLGFVPDEDLPALYSGAKAFLFPSLFEGFGLPILEAQACGCPVITSNVSSMKEIAGDGAILIDPYDIESIVNAMEVVEDKKERESLIKKGFENKSKFSWQKCARETVKVFESI